LIASKNDVLEYLTSVIKGESISEVIVTIHCGSGISQAKIIQKKPEEKEKLKAAELIAKICNFFDEKDNTNSIIPVIIKGSDEIES